MSKGRRLPRSFYARPTLEVARELIGARLVRRFADGGRVAGRIVEIEAYIGEDDRACHAAAGRTPRASTLFGDPGHAYVYLIYGMHFMLNAVTEPRDQPAAILIRGVEPTHGLDRMAELRNVDRRLALTIPRQRAILTSGPGRLSRAFGVDKGWNGADLVRGDLFITAGPPPPRIEQTVRIGIDYAGDCKDRPWRFIVPGNPFVSGPRTLNGKNGRVAGQRT